MNRVIIVGAGPIGLVLAIQLATLGVKAVVIDAKSQVSSGSRAAALTRRSMEIIEQAGVANDFLGEAIFWNSGKSYYRGQVVHNLELTASADDKFSPLTNIPQCFMEEFLIRRAEMLGVDLRFQSKSIAISSDHSGAVLTIDTPEGEYEARADWVVACDGAHSPTRKMVGLRFEGNSFEDRFIIGDIRIRLKDAPGRRCYFDPPWLPGKTVIMHMLYPDIWRLDYQVPAEVTDEEALNPQWFKSKMQAHLDYIGVAEPWEIEWVTLYKPNALTLERYNHDRVLFAGDAAHLLPVFGVRGMNTGVQDAINLAWKLALVIRGVAVPELLDSYTSERVADARQICVEASRSTRMVAPPTRGFKIMQSAVLSLALNHEFVRDLLHWRTSYPIDYADSPLTVIDATEDEFVGGPRPGAPALNARIDRQGESVEFLFDYLTNAFSVVIFGDDAALIDAALRDVKDLRQAGLPIRTIGVGTGSTAVGISLDAVLSGSGSHIFARWGVKKSALYILRPDQHVAARWTENSDRTVSDVITNIIRFRQAPAPATSQWKD